MPRPRQLVLLGAVVFILICITSFYRSSPNSTPRPPLQKPVHHDIPQYQPLHSGINFDDEYTPHSRLPIPAPDGVHPMQYLIAQAEQQQEATEARQSKTIDEAVAEYRRRYGVPPPPNFDRWFEFAQTKGIQLIDEFDLIYESLTPFWGLKPATIRERAAEALGYENALLGISIRGGEITHIHGGDEWQRVATLGMMAEFLEFLPDMDLCFNLHDEPRVIVPYEDMARLVRRAKEVNMPAANIQHPVNEFTHKPVGLNYGKKWEEYKTTRFNVFAHQTTWTHSRMSCSPNSASRGLEEDELQDDLSRYEMGELGFVYNMSAQSDICNSPSLSSTFGFFDRPNAFNIVHDLFPIFSQSKLSSFSDILYPSPWYWFEKVPYDENQDVEWEGKYDRFYWRGSTTGGFSRNGGWRRQHRQHFVKKVHAVEDTKVLVNTGTENDPKWETKVTPRGEFRDLMDIFFSGVGQCDPGDCVAQNNFFTIKSHASQQGAWAYKYLLDIDGNAFSGRFYAFLKSKSLVYKWAIFREWHMEWLKPWAHYIPLSLQGEDWVEAVRYFASSESGKKEGERLAKQQSDWAHKVLRHEDMEVWFFRLLLEYGRVIDDNRATIGYAVDASNPKGAATDQKHVVGDKHNAAVADKQNTNTVGKESTADKKNPPAVGKDNTAQAEGHKS
ncbi:hypothetical protein GGR57DRAFT_447041 [Xylariaceae sp. FL1272]|nr:hypothetical protein GGR57DRAFT_447041 [Xylariaceae sp. FL1272]